MERSNSTVWIGRNHSQRMQTNINHSTRANAQKSLNLCKRTETTQRLQTNTNYSICANDEKSRNPCKRTEITQTVQTNMKHSTHANEHESLNPCQRTEITQPVQTNMNHSTRATEHASLNPCKPKPGAGGALLADQPPLRGRGAPSHSLSLLLSSLELRDTNVYEP